MNFWQWLNGTVTVKLICADPAFAISNLIQGGVAIRSTQILDEFSVVIQVSRQDVSKLCKICQNKGYDLQILKRNGLFYWLKWTKRPVITAGLLLLLALTWYLPKRILFFQVQGNQTIPTELILDKAADCGIQFGASRADVRSEQVKNALLEAIPQLQWAGINTNGCVATISVRERTPSEMIEPSGGVSSIAASMDGVITGITVTRGSQKCSSGQLVKKGDILISGYTDCGISVRAERAKGEVYAKTERELEGVIPVSGTLRERLVSQEKKYSVIIGKNRINLYFNSGISATGCVRMYEQRYVTLPGGFQLPILIVTETIYCYESDAVSLAEAEAHRILSGLMRELVSREMIGGAILSCQETLQCSDEIWRLHCSYSCEEMIGKEQKEEILIPNGSTNRTDR